MAEKRFNRFYRDARKPLKRFSAIRFRLAPG